MVTSDPDANITAPVHVAHAFTVHAEEDETGADTIQETELTSGLFYGYVVVDIPGLLYLARGALTARDGTLAFLQGAPSPVDALNEGDYAIPLQGVSMILLGLGFRHVSGPMKTCV